MFLYRLVGALDGAGVDYAIAGGFAVALHGAVRGTVDVDLVILLTKDSFRKVEGAFSGLGLKSRLPVSADEVFDFREEYVRNRNLFAWSFTNPADPAEAVDILLTHDLANLQVTTLRAGGHDLRVISVKDLIGMKEQCDRPQDLEDVRALRVLHQ